MTENTEFLGTTFEYVGGKLKTLAKFFFVVGILASVILGIVLFVNAGNASQMSYIGESMSGFYITLGFIILIGGTIMTVLFSFVLYALGAVAEKYLNEKEEKAADYKSRWTAYNNATPATKRYWECPKCGMLVPNSSSVCSSCGTSKPHNNNTQEAVLQPGEWVCSKCGRVNPGYVGTCGCGGTKENYINNAPQSAATAENEYSVSDLNDEAQKEIARLNGMFLNGQITKAEFDRRFDEIVNNSDGRATVKRCPGCNAELRADAEFCTNCGRKIY